MEEEYVTMDYPSRSPNGWHTDAVKVHGGELICCPRCDKANLFMETTSLRRGLVVGNEGSGMFADYYCETCNETFTLGFYNQQVSHDTDGVAARVNWMQKI